MLEYININGYEEWLLKIPLPGEQPPLKYWLHFPFFLKLAEEVVEEVPSQLVETSSRTTPLKILTTATVCFAAGYWVWKKWKNSREQCP